MQFQTKTPKPMQTNTAPIQHPYRTDTKSNHNQYEANAEPKKLMNTPKLQHQNNTKSKINTISKQNPKSMQTNTKPTQHQYRTDTTSNHNQYNTNTNQHKNEYNNITKYKKTNTTTINTT